MIRRLLQRYFVTGLLTLIPIWLTWIVFKFVFQACRCCRRRGSARCSIRWRRHIRAVRLAGVADYPVRAGRADDGLGDPVHRLAEPARDRQAPAAAVRADAGTRAAAKTIYGGTKQLLEALQTKPDGTQRVVLIDFPSPEMKTIGLVTRVLKDARTARKSPPSTCRPRRIRPRVIWRWCRWSGSPDRLERGSSDELHHFRRRDQPGHHSFRTPRKAKE
jgi:hypothetical protein